MTTPNQRPPDGAYVIDQAGGEYNYGQGITDKSAASLMVSHFPSISLLNPLAAVGSAISVVADTLFGLPLEVLQLFENLIPGDLGDAFQSVAGAVGAIVDHLSAIGPMLGSVVFHALSDGFNFLQSIVNQIMDILNGVFVTPINEAVQHVKDWFNSLPSIPSIVGSFFDIFHVTGHPLDLGGLTAGLTDWFDHIPIPNVDGLAGAISGLVSDISGTINAAVNGLAGLVPGDGFTWLVGDLFNQSRSIAASLAQLGSAIALLQEENSPEASGGLSKVVDYTALPDGALDGSHSIVNSLSGTRTPSILSGSVNLQASSGNKNSRRSDITHSFGTLTDTQKVSIVLGTSPNYFDGGFPSFGHWDSYDYIYARSDAAGNNRIWARIGDGGVAIGYRVGGSDVTWDTASHKAQVGAIYSLICGTSGGSRIFKLSCNGLPVLTHSEVGTTSMLGSGYRLGGYGVQSEGDNSTNYASPGAVSAYAIQDNVLPTYTGSGARVYRANTASAGLAANTIGFTDEVMNSPVFDTADFVTNDLTWSPGVSEVHTVSITGAPTGGTWTYTVGGQTTAALARNITPANLATAIVALSNVGSNGGIYQNVTVTGTAGVSYTITFSGGKSNTAMGTPSVAHSFTGGTTPNVTALRTATGTHGNCFTVSRTGWYLLQMSLINGGGGNMRMTVYKNGTKQWDQGLTTNNTDQSTTFVMYLNAGDYIQPGIVGSGFFAQGDAAGARTHMELIKIDN